MADDELDIDEMLERAEQAAGDFSRHEIRTKVCGRDVPALCDEVERLREENARLRDRLFILADNILTWGVDSDPDAIIDRVVEVREELGERTYERKRLYADREGKDDHDEQ